jgi:hypothetical protein
MLLAPDLRDWLAGIHPARWIDDLVEHGAGSIRVYADYTEVRGAPPHDSSRMLKILIYGYSHGVTSSRALERRCNDDIAFPVPDCAGAPGLIDSQISLGTVVKVSTSARLSSRCSATLGSSRRGRLPTSRTMRNVVNHGVCRGCGCVSRCMCCGCLCVAGPATTFRSPLALAGQRIAKTQSTKTRSTTPTLSHRRVANWLSQSELTVDTSQESTPERPPAHIAIGKGHLRTAGPSHHGSHLPPRPPEPEPGKFRSGLGSAITSSAMRAYPMTRSQAVYVARGQVVRQKGSDQPGCNVLATLGA